MAASASRSGRRVIGGINMTPFVDIVLVLLVVFLMAAKLVQGADALPLELPRAANGEAGAEQNVTLSIAADGTVTADWEAIAKAEHVIIAADAEAAHKHVIAAMDRLAKMNVAHVAFAVKH